MPVCTPEYYLQRGYKVAARADYQIWLVHPSGRQRYLFGGHSSTRPPDTDALPPEPVEREQVPPPERVPPPIVDPPPDDLLQTDEPPIDYSRPR
jgi:hypothetical protein